MLELGLADSIEEAEEKANSIQDSVYVKETKGFLLR
jgi:hypothetical protein